MQISNTVNTQLPYRLFNLKEQTSNRWKW